MSSKRTSTLSERSERSERSVRPSLNSSGSGSARRTSSMSSKTVTPPAAPAALPGSTPSKRRSTPPTPLTTIADRAVPSSASVRSTSSAAGSYKKAGTPPTPSAPLPSERRRRSHRSRGTSASVSNINPIPRRPPRSTMRLSLANSSMPDLDRGAEAIDSPADYGRDSTASPAMPATPSTPGTPGDGIVRPLSAHIRGGGRTRRKPVPTTYADEGGMPVDVLATPPSSLSNQLYPGSETSKTADSSENTHSSLSYVSYIPSHSSATLLFQQPDLEETLVSSPPPQPQQYPTTRRSTHGRPSAGSLSSLSGVSMLGLGHGPVPGFQDGTGAGVRVSRSASLGSSALFGTATTDFSESLPSTLVGSSPYGYPQKQQYLLPVDPPMMMLDSPPVRPACLPPNEFLKNTSAASLESSTCQPLTSNSSHSHLASASTPILPRYSTADTEATLTPHYQTRRSRANTLQAPNVLQVPYVGADSTIRSRSRDRNRQRTRSRGQSISTWFSLSSIESDEPVPTRARGDMNRRPPNTARSLWKWGFLFPPLWILGAFIVHTRFSQSHRARAYHRRRASDDSADPEKLLQAETAACLMRNIEHKYARRSLVSLILFTITAMALIVSLVVVFTVVRK